VLALGLALPPPETLKADPHMNDVPVLPSGGKPTSTGFPPEVSGFPDPFSGLSGPPE
jgi:hypothetical protein